MTSVNQPGQPLLMNKGELQELLAPITGPCVSIYMTTSRLPQEHHKNRIGFKDRLKEAERSLEAHGSEPDTDAAVLAPLHQLAENESFWFNQQDGLAVFAAPGYLRVRKLLRPVPDISIVAHSFHVKPLIRIMQDAGRYHLLCVSTERVALHEGDRERLVAVELAPDVPRDMAEAIGEPSHVTKTRPSQYDFDDSDQRDTQLRRYFRRVDDAIWRYHNRDARLPLILAALPEYHGLFHAASHNPRLLDTGLRRDPFHGLDLRELGEQAWNVAAPARDRVLADWLEAFGTAKAHGQGSDDLEQIARDAVAARIRMLIIREDHRVGGEIDRATGEITFKPIEDPATDDVVDDIAELVLHRGGDVLIAPTEQTIGATGVAAIYWG
ncbi:MAG: hypothetical protein ACODAQ_13215 [Phycisphaeraceae bacterium]